MKIWMIRISKFSVLAILALSLSSCEPPQVYGSVGYSSYGGGYGHGGMGGGVRIGGRIY